jgi:hypothetical protein
VDRTGPTGQTQMTTKKREKKLAPNVNIGNYGNKFDDNESTTIVDIQSSHPDYSEDVLSVIC